MARISKGLIEEVTNREIAASIPYTAKIVGLYLQGSASGQTKPSVEILTAEREATFVIHAAGTAQTWVRAVRGPVVATGPASLPFASTTRVGFDGRKFARLETTAWVEVDFDLENIEGRRGRLPGRVVGRLAMPIGQRLVPRAERQAKPIGECYLQNFVDQTADTIIDILNRTTPVEASLHRVYPKTRDWVFHVSTTPGYVQAAYGPPASKTPILPKNPNRVAGDVWLELWLQSTDKEAQLMRDLGKSPLARAILLKYLEATVPELAAIAADWAVAAVDSWVVLSIRPEVPKSIPLDPTRARSASPTGEPGR